MPDPTKPTADPGGNRIARNVAAMRAQGADEKDIETYLTQHEGLQPVAAPATATPSAPVNSPVLAPRDATSARLRPAARPHTLGEDLTGAAGAVAQGMTGGLADEIMAGAAGLVTSPLHPFRHFEKLRQQAAEPEQQFAANHPVLDIGGQLGGAIGQGALANGVRTALVGSPVVAQAAGKVPLLQRTLGLGKQVATAGVVGAGVGAASGEGSVGERAAAAEQGAKIAAGLTVAGKGLGGALRATGVSALVSKLAPRPATESNALSRVLTSHEGMAARDILADFERSGMTVDDYLARAKANPEHPLYDLGPSMPQGTGSALIRRDPGGDPLVRRARAVQSISSRGSAEVSDFTNSRAEARPALIRNSLEQGLGTPRVNVIQSLEQDAADRSAASTDFYDVLRGHYDQAPKRIAALDQHLGKPSFESAVKEAESILRERDPQNFTPLTVTDANGVRRVRPLTFTEADLLKRSLDDVTDAAKVPNPIESGGVGKTRHGEMGKTSTQVVKSLDDAFPGNKRAGVPSYAEVRGQHQDASALINAKDAGQDFLRTTGDQLEADLAKMSDTQRQSYRTGAIAHIEDDMAKGDIGKWLKGPNLRKLRMLFPDAQQADQFETALRREVQGSANDAMVMRGSPTARIFADQADLNAGPEVATSAARSLLSPSRAAESVVNSALGDRFRVMTEARADALAPYLTARGPQLNQKLLYLKALQDEMALGAKQARVRAQRTAGQLGGIAGARSTP